MKQRALSTLRLGYVLFGGGLAFVIGGLSGVTHAEPAHNMQQTDTYYIVAHIHYVLYGGSVFTIMAGVYYWYPKVTGRYMNEVLGKIHFVGSFIAINFIFMPMFIQGLAGMNRRLYDGGTQYAHVKDVLAVYGWLLGQGIKAQDIVVGGDSAGGGLALSMLLALREAGATMPLAVILMSPWVDLTTSMPSHRTNRKYDP